ncbi:MAG: EFR1 family ferrodoxin [Peptoniphilus grossensis]|uniref:EFR1 family ferrodoxin n=1 Tax=Peptoniphilus grossensis TaxID=1465756 RepID=UPI002911AF61|nr:EFR1 family ferrodoxin [Peptoniphilus grossensis]MDU5100383.1 EFR1 family ferrodoxin [Peptoniphilus grossensis]
MIIYFSATGNCKYLATRIGKEFNQEIFSMVDFMREAKFDFQDDEIGIISPTYNWGLPSLVKDFLEKIDVRAKYLYFISTYGTTPGASDVMAKRALSGIKINAFYSVKMADTWTPIFDLSTEEKVEKFTKKTEKEIDSLIERIRNREENEKMSPRMPSFLVDLFAQPLYNSWTRKTSNFHVEDTCIGCGLCQRKCPIAAIKLVNERPVWVKEKCIACLGCLHRCPKFSIQYGKHTKKHGQYTNPHVRV